MLLPDGFKTTPHRRDGSHSLQRVGGFRWGILTLLFFGMGCGLLSTRKDPGPGISKADYERSCGSCHQAYKPKLKTEDEWQVFVMEHRFLSGQDEETAQLFADYLKREN